jgi:hypothetical protein
MSLSDSSFGDGLGKAPQPARRHPWNAMAGSGKSIFSKEFEDYRNGTPRDNANEANRRKAAKARGW